VLGSFESTVTPIQVFGPCQQASPKEIQMLAEADRIGSIRSFWWTQPIYTTRGAAPVPSTQGAAATGSGATYTLATPPPDGSATVYVSGVQQTPGIDYTLSGVTLTFTYSPSAAPYVTWPITAFVGQSASDILQYQNERYRVMSVFHVAGSGYYKAMGTRMDAA
jgi:hypothetical protein